MTFSFRRHSWQLLVDHPDTMRQAGMQLYYSSGMAGSAEGEALTPILMRLYTSQWPNVCRRIRQKQSHSYQRAYCLIEQPPGSHTASTPPFRAKVIFSSLSISIPPTFETIWHLHCTLHSDNNTALTKTTRTVDPVTAGTCYTHKAATPAQAVC